MYVPSSNNNQGMSGFNITQQLYNDLMHILYLNNTKPQINTRYFTQIQAQFIRQNTKH